MKAIKQLFTVGFFFFVVIVGCGILIDVTSGPSPKVQEARRFEEDNPETREQRIIRKKFEKKQEKAVARNEAVQLGGESAGELFDVLTGRREAAWKRGAEKRAELEAALLEYPLPPDLEAAFSEHPMVELDRVIAHNRRALELYRRKNVQDLDN